MAKKSLSLKELTEYELFKLEAEEKYVKYEKEISKYKKNITNLKRKDRLFTKAINLCESKITKTKENSMNSLLFLCENIKEIRKNFSNSLDEMESDVDRESFSLFEKEFEYIMNTIYEVCNKIEEDSVFTKLDREVISNKFEMSDLAEVDNDSNFSKLADEFRKNIMRKNGKDTPEKVEFPPEMAESDGDDVDSLESEVLYNSEYYNDQIKVQNKFNKMFYEAPTDTQKVVSSIAGNDDFDFNEALNPTLSLSDIMGDLMGGLDEEDGDEELPIEPVKKEEKKEEKPKKSNGFEGLEYLGEEDDDYGFSYGKTNNIEEDSEEDDDDYYDDEFDDEEFDKLKQKRFEKIESKIQSSAKIERREIDEANYSNKSSATQNLEERFTRIQNLFKDNKDD